MQQTRKFKIKVRKTPEKDISDKEIHQDFFLKPSKVQINQVFVKAINTTGLTTVDMSENS